MGGGGGGGGGGAGWGGGGKGGIYTTHNGPVSVIMLLRYVS